MIALGIALAVYIAVAVAVLVALDPGQLVSTTDPLARAVATGSWSFVVPLVQIGASVAALGSLLALILGISRTTLAMARDGNLPRTLSAVHPRYAAPHHAELAVGVVVALLAALVDLGEAIGFSSFTVLVYYAIANAAAWTLSSRARTRIVPAVGLAGCLVLAFSLPVGSVLSGTVVLLIGVVIRAVRQRLGQQRLGR